MDRALDHLPGHDDNVASDLAQSWRTRSRHVVDATFRGALALRMMTLMTQRITVHDPRGYPPKVVGKRLAPRLSTLDGKTVYLVDCLFDNSAVFMDQLQHWFGEHLPAYKPKPLPTEYSDLRFAEKNTGALIAETADLWFHSLVMLSHLGENADAVLAELARRFGISGLEEKAGRNQ